MPLPTCARAGLARVVQRMELRPPAPARTGRTLRDLIGAVVRASMAAMATPV